MNPQQRVDHGVVAPAVLPPRQHLLFEGKAPAPAVTSLVAIGTAAAIGAASLPVAAAGVGWLITVFAAAAGAGAVLRRRPDLARDGWALVTVALVAVGTLRAAEWLFALCLLAAVVTGTLALVDARSVRAMAVGLTLPVVAAVLSLPWLGAGIRAAAHRRLGTARGLATAGVSAALLAVFGALFVSADAAFADLAGRALPEIGGEVVARTLFLFPLLVVAIGAAAHLRAAPPDLSGLNAPGRPRRVRPMEWAGPVALLDALFLTFVAVQLTVLFGGPSYVLGPDGPTFAEYARDGFWQLLAVTALTLLVIAAAVRWAPQADRGDRMLVRLLLGSLAVLALVVVASALYRMSVYLEAYGYTRLRVFVFAVELALAAVFLLVLVAGIRLHAAWLPRAVVAVGVTALLGLVALDPDRFVADRNVDRYRATGRIDLEYLSTLSADAVPALDRLGGDDRDCAVMSGQARLAERPDDWRAFNVARERARALLAERPAGVCEAIR